MTQSPRHAFPFILTNQSQKEITHNEAIARIDLLLHLHLQSAALSIPPEQPQNGQAWIVAAGASGAWAGHEKQIAQWLDGGWVFVPPVTGMRAWLADRLFDTIYDGYVWRSGDVWADRFTIWGQQVVGPRQPAIADPLGGEVIDVEARNTMGLILSMLRTHGLINA